MIDPVEQLRLEENDLSPDRPVKTIRRSFPQRSIVRLHYHSSLEINFCRSIHGVIRIDGVAFSLSRTSLVILPPYKLHSYDIFKSDGEIEVIHISIGLLSHWISLEAASELSSNLNPSSLVFSTEETSPVSIRPSSHNVFGALVCYFRVMELVTSRAAIAPRRTPSWLRDVVDYTEAHHHEAISLMQIAQVAGLSRSSFARQFRERTGSTYHRFLVEVRVERAKQALLSGADVTTAAHEAGFSDASHLIRTFRSKTGMTPSTWRAGAEHGQHVGENIAEQPDR